MPLRRSPLFCARNSRLRGGEDPGRGRRELRLREGASVAGQRMAAIWRWLVAGLVRRSGRWGGWPRIAWNAGTAAVGRPEKPAGREVVAGEQSGRRGGGSLPDGVGERAAPCHAAAGKSARGRAAAFPDVGGMGSKGRIFGFGFGNTAEKATFAPANGSLAVRPQGLKGNAVQVCNSSRCCEFRPGCSGLSSRQSLATDLAVGKASRRKRVRRPAFACVERKPAENGRSEDRTRSRFFLFRMFLMAAPTVR